jgi:hypothetical protein
VGVSHLVIPASEVDDAAWLRDSGIELPGGGSESRWPTPNELKEVLGALAGTTVTFRPNTAGGWDAEVVDASRGYSGPSVTIWVTGIQDPDRPTRFALHKPDLGLAIAIVERLARLCGPFLMMDDADVRPVLVTAGCDTELLLRRLSGALR